MDSPQHRLGAAGDADLAVDGSVIGAIIVLLIWTRTGARRQVDS